VEELEEGLSDNGRPFFVLRQLCPSALGGGILLPIPAVQFLKV
jgi:hypothetical protein